MPWRRALSFLVVGHPSGELFGDARIVMEVEHGGTRYRVQLGLPCEDLLVPSAPGWTRLRVAVH